MEKEALNYVIEKTNELINAFSCSEGAKVAAQAWLDALGTENEVEETEKYLNELEEDIVTVDNLISFAESNAGKKHFGEDVANNIAEHGKEIKAAGAKYCDCPACKAALAIIEKKDILLKG